jgi:hypothetical protein
MDKLLLQMTATTVILLEKQMAAELDRLNGAVAAINDQVAQVATKVTQLIDLIRNAPPGGIDPLMVNDAAAQLESAVASLQNTNSQQV